MEKMKLLSNSLSLCCQSKAMIVRSRKGGFITANCTKCGEPGYISEENIPIIDCPQCGSKMYIDKDHYKSYIYKCSGCEYKSLISELVYDWSDEFKYHGIAAYGDGE